jgi:hypothetical protein
MSDESEHLIEQEEALTMSMFLNKRDLEQALHRDRMRAAIEGIMVSHNGYSSPMLAERITDAVLALSSQDRGAP